MRFLLLLPTYNERENIVAMLDRVGQLQPDLDILVIDDGSPDGTATLVKECMQKSSRIHLQERQGKLGLGSAYQAGFRYGLENGYDAMVQMDCDFSHNPEDLSHFRSLLGDYDVVLGTRFIPGGSVENWHWLRKLVSKGGNLYARLMLRVGMHDITGGFNGYTAKALKKLGYEAVGSSSYAFQIEMKYRAHVNGLRWKEFPITFVDRKYGTSKIPRSQLLISFWQVLRWALMPKTKFRHEAETG